MNRVALAITLYAIPMGALLLIVFFGERHHLDILESVGWFYAVGLLAYLFIIRPRRQRPDPYAEDQWD